MYCTAELVKHEYPCENEIIRKGIYVDDCLSGEKSWNKVRITTDNLNIVLNKGGFCLKGLTFSGQDPPDVAGMKWFSREDKLSLKIGELNFGKKARGKKPGKKYGLVPKDFIRRTCVGKVAEIFDLLGKVTPLTCGMKLDLRELSTRKFECDDKIPNDLKTMWKSNFEMMKEIGNIKFKRTIIPEDSVNLDIEIIDAGDAANL